MDLIESLFFSLQEVLRPSLSQKSISLVIKREDIFRRFTSQSSINGSLFQTVSKNKTKIKTSHPLFPFVYKPPPHCLFTFSFTWDVSNSDTSPTCTFSRFIWNSCHVRPHFHFPLQAPPFAYNLSTSSLTDTFGGQRPVGQTCAPRRTHGLTPPDISDCTVPSAAGRRAVTVKCAVAIYHFTPCNGKWIAFI